jgi:kanosamine 6-kinase
VGESHLGIDIGGTKVALRFEDDRGGVLEARASWPPGGTVADDLAALTDLVQQARADWDSSERADRSGRAGRSGRADRSDRSGRNGPHSTAGGDRAPAGVGVAMPGTVAPDGRVLAWPGRPAWTGLDLAAALGRVLPGLPVAWADDGDLGALAEARHAGCDHLVYLGVGTGVGGGVVVGGQVLPGLTRGSCELGHLVVAIDGPVCDCGRAGCVQAFAGGPAIRRRAAGARGSATSPAELLDGWRAGAGWAVQALDEAAIALATAVIGVGEMVLPDLALVGGGFAAVHEGFVDRVDGHVRRLTRPGRPPVPVRPAALGALSSLHGAVELARLTR